ncbi:MAG: FkbM family methyltransferase [Myxococcota bacterium]|jgi:FkbM family methyltransferase|nr:FkbM family methyltransferase [Myxococcota bacterium]
MFRPLAMGAGYGLAAICIALGIVFTLATPLRASAESILEEKKRYSQANEELIIRDFFQDRRDGFYLDVGCAFPVQFSTTYYLEKHLAWRGIGIDALDIYAKNWKLLRPKSQFFTFYVDDHSDDIKTFYRAGVPALSSGIKDRVFNGRKLNQREVEVQTITLNKLLELNGVEKVDFLSMDIEEAEPAALRGFDIERYAPELVCIEATPSIREEIHAYFEEHGYERLDRYLAHDDVNWYYAPKSRNAGEQGAPTKATPDPAGNAPAQSPPNSN